MSGATAFNVRDGHFALTAIAPLLFRSYLMGFSTVIQEY